MVSILGAPSLYLADAQAYLEDDVPTERQHDAFFKIMQLQHMRKPHITYAIAEEDTRWMVVVYDANNVGLVDHYQTYTSKKDSQGKPVGEKRVLLFNHLVDNPGTYNIVISLQRAMDAIYQWLGGGVFDNSVGTLGVLAQALERVPKDRFKDTCRLGAGMGAIAIFERADKLACKMGHIVDWVVEDRMGEVVAHATGTCRLCGSSNFEAYSWYGGEGWELDGTYCDTKNKKGPCNETK